MGVSASAALALGLCLLKPPPTEPGGWPRPTKAGVEAMMALVDRCAATGGLRSVGPPLAVTPHYEVADEAKLAATVKAERAWITTALVDTLIGGWRVFDVHEERFAAALLRAIGETGDDRAAAFGGFFAGSLAARRKTDEAVGSLDGAARLFAKIGDPFWQATAYHEAGIALRAAGDYGRAIDRHRRALAIRLDALDGDHPLIATTLNNLGVVYEAVGDFPKAEEFHRRALAIRSKVLADDDPALAWTERNLGMVLFKTGRLDEAEALLEAALAIRRRHADTDPALLADALGGLGVLRSERGRLDEAAALFNDELAILCRLGPGRELDVAEVTANLGVAAERGGDLPRALRLLGEALKIRRRPPARHPDIAHNLNELAQVHHDLGDLDKALVQQLEALSIHRQFFGREHPEVARSLNNLGSLYREQGDEPRALALYREALAIWRKTYPGPHPDVAFCLDNIAGIYQRRGAWGEATANYREALSTLESVLGPRHPQLVQNLNGLALVSDAAGRGDEALGYDRRAVEIARAAYPGGHPAVTSSLNNLAMAEARRGDLAGAERDLREARAIARKFGPGSTDEASILESLATVQRRAGRLDGADRALAEALDALRPADPGADVPATPIAGRLLACRAELSERLAGDHPGAAAMRRSAALYEAADDVLERLRGGVLDSAEGKLEAGENAYQVFPRLIGLRRRLFDAEGRADDLRAAFDAAERATARVFLESLGRSRAGRLGGVTPDLLDREAAIEARLRSLFGRIDAEGARPAEQRRPEVVGKLIHDREESEAGLSRLRAQIRAAFPRYAALTDPKPCSLAEARACLGVDEVALLFVPGDDRSELIVLTKEDDPRTSGLSVHPLPPAAEFTDRVTALTQAKVLGDADAARERGAELYRVLLAPVADSIRGKALVVVPGGPLAGLAFELLVEPPGPGDGDGSWLIEQHAIRYAPSLTVLHLTALWEKTRPEPDRPFWALGDPVYRPDDPRLTAGPAPGREAAEPGDGHRDTFDRLPASGAEVDHLRGLLGAGTADVLLGTHATESTVKRLSREHILDRYRYVHFACHGVLGVGDGVQPALILSLYGGPEGEDGRLRLDEVTGLTLNADLVVLSACQTGQGQVRDAEGASGLGRAFLYAGSRGVLCSLWRVVDASTAELIVDTYAGLKGGRPAADALRAAQLRMIAEGEPPLFWAPFILIGR